MNIELGTLNDGRVMMVCESPLPDIVRRVEYYREQRLFMLVYRDGDTDDQLMECEVPERLAVPVEKSPNIIILTLFDDLEPVGYKAPLVKVGELY